MLEIQGLRKVFPVAKGEGRREVVAIDDLSVHVEAGEFFTFLGPSGCGKSTTLRCVAGLEHANAGEIRVDGKLLFSGQQNVNVPANQRGLGMVFQSYAIWPHMDVFKNVAFPLTVLPRSQRPGRRELRERVERVLDVMQLTEMASRPSTALSGGQQQRLALARALVMQPPVLLLDEPLSNLDAKLREEMRLELKRLQSSLGLTTIYVTHDQSEALAMSNRIAVMRGGAFEQVAEPREIYETPATRFVADFIGSSNFLTGVAAAASGTDTQIVVTDCGPITVALRVPLPPDTRVELSVRPERIQLMPVAGADAGSEPTLAPDRWRGEVLAAAFLGEFAEHLVAINDVHLRVRTESEITFSPGTRVELGIPGDAVSVFREGEGVAVPMGSVAAHPVEPALANNRESQ